MGLNCGGARHRDTYHTNKRKGTKYCCLTQQCFLLVNIRWTAASILSETLTNPAYASHTTTGLATV